MRIDPAILNEEASSKARKNTGCFILIAVIFFAPAYGSLLRKLFGGIIGDALSVIVFIGAIAYFIRSRRN